MLKKSLCLSVSLFLLTSMSQAIAMRKELVAQLVAECIAAVPTMEQFYDGIEKLQDPAGKLAVALEECALKNYEVEVVGNQGEQRELNKQQFRHACVELASAVLQVKGDLLNEQRMILGAGGLTRSEQDQQRQALKREFSNLQLRYVYLPLSAVALIGAVAYHNLAPLLNEWLYNRAHGKKGDRRLEAHRMMGLINKSLAIGGAAALIGLWYSLDRLVSQYEELP